MKVKLKPGEIISGDHLKSGVIYDAYYKDDFIRINQCGFSECQENCGWFPTRFEIIKTEKINIEEKTGPYEILGKSVGKLVDEKNTAYGSAFDKAGDFLKILYPNGISPKDYKNMLCLVRMFDKCSRIATSKDAFGENPWQDICGYALLALKNEDYIKIKKENK